MQEKTSLVVMDTFTTDVYTTKEGLTPFLKLVTDEVNNFTADVTTEEGRKEIKSFAYKIVRSRTGGDEVGIELVSDWKAKSSEVDARRKTFRDVLNALRDKVKAPLIAWEAEEESRKAGHLTEVEWLSAMGALAAENWQTSPVGGMEKLAAEVENRGRDCEEFQERADVVKATTLTLIADAITRRKKHDTDQAELEALRKDKEEREAKQAARAAKDAQEARDAHIKREAAGEVKAKAIRKAENVAKRAAEEKAELQREKDEAEQRATDAEEAAKVAAQQERDKIEAEAKAKGAAVARRAADEEYMGNVRHDMATALYHHMDAATATPDQAKHIVQAIIDGQIPHVKFDPK